MLRPLVVLVGDRQVDCAELFERLQAREAILALGYARDMQETWELARVDGLDVIVAPSHAATFAEPASASSSSEPRRVEAFVAERSDFTLSSAAILEAFGDPGCDLALSVRLAASEASAIALAHELELRRSLRSAQMRARRLETSQAVFASLAEACTPADVADALLEGVLALGGRGAVLFAGRNDDLLLTQVRGYDDQAVRRLECIRREPESQQVLEAVRTGRSVWSKQDDPVALFRAALPLRIGDEPWGVLAVDFEACTFESDDERRSLDQLAALGARALRRAERFAALQELLAEKRLMLGIASHDLRTPLQVVLAASELLARQGGLAEAGSALVSHIGEAARRAQQLVAQVLELSRVELSESPVRNVDEDLFELLRTAVDELRVRAPDCHVTVALRGSGTVATDARRVQQILQNVLANAAHYREPGSSIEVRGEGFEQRVYVEVTNRGPVIDEQQLAALFAPMKRGTRSGERGSLGLGLYIVERLASEIGARVWARSTEEAGTTFHLELARHADGRAVPIAHEGGTVTRPASSPPPPPPDEYEELLRELEGTPHRRLLALWLSLRGTERLPDPRQLELGAVLASLPDMFRVLVQPEQHGSERVFCYEYVGAALERRLRGRMLRGSWVVTRDDPMQIGIHAAYERCVQSRRPQFDYLRTGPSKPRRESFRRLILPLSSDGGSVTHLLGLATFSGMEEAVGREREPALITGHEPR
jgi:signal transduction histidine kinase